MPKTSLEIRRRGRSLLLIGGSLAAGLLLAEVALRVAGFSFPPFFIPDMITGTAHRPGAQGWNHNEGNAYIRINRAGFRDGEHALEKPPGTLRIAILGDSIVEALQVPLEQTFGRLLEQNLSLCFKSRRVEVLNFGVSGYGTAQELLTLRHKVWPYQPDVVLLVFFAGNDVRNNHRALNGDPLVPYFFYHENRLALDASFRERLQRSPTSRFARSARDWLSQRCRVVQLCEWARFRMASKKKERSGGKLDPGGESGLDDSVFTPPRDAVWREAWHVTEGLLLAVRDEVKEHGARLDLVIVPGGIQVHPDAGLRESFRRKIGVEDLDYPARRIENFAAKSGIRVVSLVDGFREFSATSRVFTHGFPNANPGFGHLNETGHRLAAEILAAQLCPEVLKEAPRKAGDPSRRKGPGGEQQSRPLALQSKTRQLPPLR